MQANKDTSPSQSKGMSTTAKVALGITITSLVVVIIFLIYNEVVTKNRKK